MEIDLIVSIDIEEIEGGDIYSEKRKIVILRSGSQWSRFRDIKNTKDELFKDITIEIDETKTAATGRLTFTVAGMSSTVFKTKFKYFSNIKM